MIDVNMLDHPMINKTFQSFEEQFCLTKREIEVLKLLAVSGASSRELGQLLYVSEKTIKNHIANIKAKMNARTTKEIQAFVVRDTFRKMASSY